MESFDILTPPTFQKSGIIKPRSQAFTDGDWVGTFNLWIIQSEPTPAIIYQQRGANATWAPSKLDVTAGGHYQAGESIYDGMREVEEELHRTYAIEALTYLGRKLHVSPDVHGLVRHNVVDIFFVTDNAPLESYKIDPQEVYALISCPIEDLIKAHTTSHSFEAKGFDNEHQPISITVDKESFPYNWDDYHFKIALLAKRYLLGEEYLIY
jgi:hypothetical protein